MLRVGPDLGPPSAAPGGPAGRLATASHR